jgi:CheY-like chemotaxis protein
MEPSVTDHASALSGLRVLVVEDDYMIATDISEGLASMGAQVIGPAADLTEARRLVAEKKIDAVVLDLNLEGQIAVDLADDLVARQIPFVLATGYQAEGIPPRHAHVPRCEKPFNSIDVAKALHRLCRR